MAAASTRAAVVGAATMVIGSGLALAPAAIAGRLQLHRPGAVRLVGLLDVALAPGLLTARTRWPWMVARVAANLGIVGYLLDESRATHARRPRAAAFVLAAITVGDGSIAAACWQQQHRPVA